MPKATFGSGQGIAVQLIVDGYRSLIRENLVVMFMPSKTNKTKLYRLEHSPHATTCECPGFEYKSTCWHVDRAKELFKFLSRADG